MLASGYNNFERDMIVTEGIASFKNIKAKVDQRKRPLYRKGDWNKLERCIEKKIKAKMWHGKENVSVLFVQATPNEELRKLLQKEAEKAGLKIKVIEKGGRSIKSMLQKSDIEPQKSCGDINCVICKTKETGLCEIENAGYNIYCKKCKQQRQNYTC